MKTARKDFPEGFIFGAATSAYQIEGSAFGSAGSCHWDTFAATPGNVVRAEDGSRACDHHGRWREDLDLLRDGNFDAYRFSVSWARVLPEGRGTPNAEGIDFYDRLVDGMLERGLKPFLTLYHWELPSALALRGGWMNRDIAAWFTDYSRLVMSRLGDRVAATATINEPWCVAWLSHFLGIHAPGLRDIRAAAHAMHNVLRAHGEATAALRADGHGNLGIVLNFDHAEPASQTAEDRAAATTQDAIFNRWFIEAVTRGTYPEEALSGLGPHMPGGWEADMARISQPIDWLGINYYTRHFHAADPGAPWPATREITGPLAKTTMGWEIYPEGLRNFLTRMARDHVGDLPLYVTENGMSWDDRVENGAVEDAARIAYIDGHLSAVREAIGDGANVRGFFYWSLLDNFEWSLGYEKRFGLVHVDFDTLKRTPKASYQALARALAPRI
ncbi:GH1 family beta-glucosidase [Ostreiculturibacter nitratireducens]|uniref:GH1 family beta-glucosidase n=1 Tax=Ostreiculturibacter nitratireducens TaxID=3075226 RepID=UPI0031B5AB37